MRDITAYLIAPVLKVTGHRFGKHHRQQEDLIFRTINTVLANQLAG